MRIIYEDSIRVEMVNDTYVVTELRYQRAKESLIRRVLMMFGHLVFPIFLLIAGLAVWSGFTYSTIISCQRLSTLDGIKNPTNNTSVTAECQVSRDYLLRSDEVIVQWQSVSGVRVVPSHETCFVELVLPNNQSLPLSSHSSSTQCTAYTKIREMNQYIQLPRQYWENNNAKNVSFGGSVLPWIGGGVLIFLGIAMIKYMMSPGLLTQIIIDKHRHKMTIDYLTIFGSYQRVIKFSDIVDIIFLAKLNSDTEQMKVQKHEIRLANSKPIDVLICYDHDEMLAVHQEMKQWIGLG
ncbi:hypothetical protein [Psychrobacter sp. I-STPA6b]|uniref:hypothetical protein n=1 Tax=Psychrobacter sp. I-STPA6b TaxID=2585718 RepID=UPI001D0CC780|nr:hypothetical protein [Psychrobacter sp. I-STPA6b]